MDNIAQVGICYGNVTREIDALIMGPNFEWPYYTNYDYYQIMAVCSQFVSKHYSTNNVCGTITKAYDKAPKFF